MARNNYPISAGLIVIALFSIVISALSLFSQSIRLDESQSIWVATKSSLGILEFMSKDDVHPPLYNLLLHFWIQFFGPNIILTRTLSFIFYLLTLPAVYLLAKESSNSKIAILTLLLFSLSPFILWFSNETRMYTLFTLLTTLNNLYFLRIFRSEGSEGKSGYLLSTILGLYTHYFFGFVVLTQILFSFFQSWSKKGLLLNLVFLWLLAGLAFSPWAAAVILQGFGSTSQPTLAAPTAFNIFQSFVVFLFGFQHPAIQAALVSLWPLLMIFFLIIFTKRQKDEAKGIEYFLLITFLPVIIVFLVSFIRPIFLSRYLIFVLPTLSFLIAWSINTFPERITRFLTTGILLTMSGLLLLQNFSSTTPVREDYRDVSSYLSQEATPNDIVAVSAPFTVYPIEFSYSGHTKIVTIPEWNRYETGPTPAFSLESLKAQMEKYRGLYNRIFVVLSYDQGYEQRIRSYMDNNFELLGFQDFSPGIQLRVYKLRYD